LSQVIDASSLPPTTSPSDTLPASASDPTAPATEPTTISTSTTAIQTPISSETSSNNVSLSDDLANFDLSLDGGSVADTSLLSVSGSGDLGVDEEDVDPEMRAILENLKKGKEQKIDSTSAATTTGGDKKKIADMTYEEKMQWIKNRKVEVKKQKELAVFESIKAGEKNRQELGKAAVAVNERLEEARIKAAAKSKKKEEEDKRKSRERTKEKIREQQEKRQRQAELEKKELKDQQKQAERQMTFAQCVSAMQKNTRPVSNEDAIELDALYNQSMNGDCTSPQPWAFQSDARVKWDAWMKLNGTTKSIAQKLYVTIATKYLQHDV